MRWELARVDRLPNWPRWAVVIVGLWVLTAWAAVWLNRITGAGHTLCPFKRLTALPCPTCGAARGAAAILHGDLVTPWIYNPLLFGLLSVAGGLLLVRLLTGTAIRLHASHRERSVAWGLFFIVILANWVYLILCGV